MTILPKKKTTNSKNEPDSGPDHGQQTHYMGQLPNQPSDSHERLYVSGGVSDDLGLWLGAAAAGSPRPHPSAASPPHQQEKRHSPLHPQDYEDSLDGAPSSKRARQHRGAGGVRERVQAGGAGPGLVLASARVTAEPPRVPSPQVSAGCSRHAGVQQEQDHSDTEVGYNSEDEYSHVGGSLSEAEWLEKDRRFEAVMRRKGYIIKQMGEDGACLFRAVADQLLGDQEMHHCVRAQCMDYIVANADYYSQYITEDFDEYVLRKRTPQVHGNHLEIQAMSELYSRPIHIYCYSAEPINIFQQLHRPDSALSVPIRLCYHRGVHYNSLEDPSSPCLGLGLGLPAIKQGVQQGSEVRAALNQRENILTEQQMLEDKIKATDWEATNEAIEEQVARESYLQWLEAQEKAKKGKNPPAATVTSGQVSPRASPAGGRSPLHALQAVQQGPPGSLSASPGCTAASRSPVCVAGCSTQPDSLGAQGRDSPKPGSSRGQQDHGLGPGFHIRETASFLNGLPPDMFGLEEWGEDAVLSQVLAASRQEYLDQLKCQDKPSEDDKDS